MNGLRTLPIGQLHESPLNPRKKFDDAELAELADSRARTRATRYRTSG